MIKTFLTGIMKRSRLKISIYKVKTMKTGLIMKGNRKLQKPSKENRRS